MMSDHMKKALVIIVGACLVLLVPYMLLKSTISEFSPAPQVELPADDKELVTIDDNAHTISVTTEAGTKTTYSRNPTIELRKDGTLSVKEHTWGLEFNPFVGVGYQDTRRLYIGVNHFYFHRIDVFTAIGFPMNNSYVAVEPMMGLSYNFWHNCSINVGLNPVNVILRQKPEPALVLSVRL